eukprot:scaffold54828_cov30-Tisochrysis_lutea.AAC.18
MGLSLLDTDNTRNDGADALFLAALVIHSPQLLGYQRAMGTCLECVEVEDVAVRRRPAVRAAHA